MGVTVREKEKGSGVYYVFINHNKKRIAKRIGEKKQAESLAEKIKASITLGQFNVNVKREDEVATIKDYARNWLDKQIRGVLSESTHERYSQVLNRDILPFFKNRRLDSITAVDVRNFINSLVKTGRTSRSISLSRTVLSSCLSEAVLEEIIKENPVKLYSHSKKRSVTVEARRPKHHKVNPFKNKEVTRLTDYALSRSPHVYGPMFMCAFRTGLRLGEFIALHWSDIDWENRRIHLQRSFKKGKITELKDGEDRMVDMSPQLQDVLQKLLKKKTVETDTIEKDICEIIFHYNGHYRAQNTVRKAFKTYLKKAGLRTIRVHDTRHTYASQLLSNGASLAYVKEQLGHSSIKTTVDLYGHLNPGSCRESLNRLDNA